LCSIQDKNFIRFGLLYIPPHVKTKLQKSGGSGQVAPIDDSRMCLLKVYYDCNIQDALANLRRVDGSIPFSELCAQRKTQVLDEGIYS
jgi:hypothetical protein